MTANGSSFGYDSNGSLTSKTDASGSWIYSWDYENRLLQATKSGGVTVSSAYDALGRRVQRSSTTSGTTKFVYDGADVVRDLDGSGATIADYINGPGVDNKLRQTAGGTTSYFVPDRLGTTRGLADSSGTLASSAGYDSYGSVTSGSTPSRYTYTGREVDNDAGLMYYRARWYYPQQGRFITEDPIGFKGGKNFYAYVENNPANLVDPSGLQRSDARWQPGELEWANGLREQMARWPPPVDECPCDDTYETVLTWANDVANRYPGAKLVKDPETGDHIEFPGSFDDVSDNLEKAGYYSGFPWAYNPFNHSGGREYRTYGSPGLHFTVGYPPAGKGFGPYPGVGIWYPTTEPYTVRTINIHIDCRNPVGAGWGDRLLHFFDFLGQRGVG
ncbi:MAG: RHS repeat-associated core domain-containing protein [Pyrinomonadaceae bacterium]